MCGTAAILSESGKTGMVRTTHFPVQIPGPGMRPLPVSAKRGRSGTRGLDVTLKKRVDVCTLQTLPTTYTQALCRFAVDRRIWNRPTKARSCVESRIVSRRARTYRTAERSCYRSGHIKVDARVLRQWMFEYVSACCMLSRRSAAAFHHWTCISHLPRRARVHRLNPRICADCSLRESHPRFILRIFWSKPE